MLGFILLFLFSLVYSIPVSVMVPLTLVGPNSELVDVPAFEDSLSTLVKNAHIDGIVVDVWWGIVETSPRIYKWNAYYEILNIAASYNLKVTFIMSFHRCGGNVGDCCDIPLPSWVMTRSDIFYKDAQGHINTEYISLGADQVVVEGRTVIQIYSDFMSSFNEAIVNSKNGDFVDSVQVGMGPAGELRYPSYPSTYWNFPGMGEYQCFDQYSLLHLETAANNSGNPYWNTVPSDVTYNLLDSSFYSMKSPNNYQTPYGLFFTRWYFGMLLNHANLILSAASRIFPKRVIVSGKVAGIHWLYRTNHAAESSAGYPNYHGIDPYFQIAQVFKKYNVLFDFTCLEMLDSEQSSECNCAPQELVSQVMNSAKRAGVLFGGENALNRYDATAFNTIFNVARAGYLHAFYYLRMDDTLLSSNNLYTFANFVARMHTL